MNNIKDILHEIDGLYDTLAHVQNRLQDVMWSLDTLEDEVCSLRAYVEDMEEKDEG